MDHAIWLELRKQERLPSIKETLGSEQGLGDACI